MSLPETPRRSRVPWVLAVTVGLCSGLAGYVIHVAQTRRIPKQIVQVRRLTDMAGSEETPAISPDGTKVAYVAMSGGKRQIWVGAAAITHDDADHFGPRWSADSKSLIYFSGGAVWKSPSSRLVDALAPGDLSHAGETLAYFRLRDSAVELMAGDHAVVKLPAGDMYSNLRWSPDDKKIAYLMNTNLMVVSVSGGEPVQAAHLAVQGFTWAPDNSGLIVSRIVSTGGELWFIPRADRDSPFQLTFGELSYESPDVSPGGILMVSRRMVYASGAAESDIVMFSGLKW